MKLKNKNIYVCPLCYHRRGAQREFDDPLTSCKLLDIRAYSFFQISDVLIHLYEQHSKTIPLTRDFFDELEKYRMRGNGGLIFTYTSSNSIDNYWLDTRKELFNTLVDTIELGEDTEHSNMEVQYTHLCVLDEEFNDEKWFERFVEKVPEIPIVDIPKIQSESEFVVLEPSTNDTSIKRKHGYFYFF